MTHTQFSSTQPGARPGGVGSVRIAIVGGNGKTGRAVARGVDNLGGEPFTLGRGADLVASLTGADRLYLIAPNMHPDEPEYVTQVIAAAKQAGLERVVYHSVAAPGAVTMPHHAAKLQAEQVVRESGLQWSILQPCAYLDNLLPAMRSRRVRVPYSVHTKFGMVALADVGDIAARVLLEDGHIGATYELGGPRLVSVSEVAHAVRARIGAEVPASSISIADWLAGPGQELGARERDWLTAMFAYYDSYGLPTGGKVAAALLGRAPVSLEEFVAAHF